MVVVKNLLQRASIDYLSYELVPTLQNRVYKVKTEDGNVFLKMFSDEPYVAQKLASLYPQLHEKGVPVPDVLYAEVSSDDPFIVLSELSGEPLVVARPKMSNDELSLFYRELGDELGRIHSITFDKFGETNDGKTVIASHEIRAGPFRTWKEMHRAIIKHRLSHLENTAFSEIITPVYEYFRQNESLIDYVVTPRLLHIDLNQENIFVENGHISGILDFDGSFIGHNEEELMRTASANFPDDNKMQKVFLREYEKHTPLDEGYESRRPYYFLSRLLVHADCLVLFGDAYRPDFKGEIARVKNEISRVIAGERPDYAANT